MTVIVEFLPRNCVCFGQAQVHVSIARCGASHATGVCGANVELCVRHMPCVARKYAANG